MQISDMGHFKKVKSKQTVKKNKQTDIGNKSEVGIKSYSVNPAQDLSRTDDTDPGIEVWVTWTVPDS